MALTTLSTTVLKISGFSTGAGGVIPSGLSISTARLTTIDSVAGPTGPYSYNLDPYSLSSNEPLSFRINGQEVARTLPSLYATQVTTNAGTFTALAFTVGNDTYLLTDGKINPASITTLTSPAVLNATAVTGIDTQSYGLLPENANTFEGQVFTETIPFGGGRIGSRIEGKRRAGSRPKPPTNSGPSPARSA